MRTALVVLAVLAAMRPGSALAQAPAADLAARVMTAVRAAMKPALPFPESDDTGSPVDGVSSGPWLVRFPQPGEAGFEVLANPLNADNQARSAKAMAQIESAIEAAQRKSQAQYDRALSESQRTGKSQDVDGVTLGDEGVAGARIDAEAHVLIEVEFNQPAYTYEVASSLEPSATPGTVVAGSVAVLSVPSHVYRDRTTKMPDEDRYCPAETAVFFGALAAPSVKRRTGANFEITASESTPPVTTAVRTLVVRLRGNQELIEDIVRKTAWAQLQALIAQ
ncbi:MAG: hypothetical protein ABI665_13455 [Vicinamibacterales bacterium]